MVYKKYYRFVRYADVLVFILYLFIVCTFDCHFLVVTCKALFDEYILQDDEIIMYVRG